MSYIAAIETAVPQFCHQQEAISRFYERGTSDEKIKRKIKMVAEKSAIETRYSVLPDYSLPVNEFTFFPKTELLEPEPSLTARMAVFKTEAISLALQAIQKIDQFDALKNSITHLITVTCTGLFAPGMDIELIKILELHPTTQRSSINFMGCNAAILALNSAHNICKSIPHAKVLIVCTELCTLHFQKNYSDDYILSTALFSDGAAAVLVTSDAPEKNYLQGFKIESFHSLIIPEGENEMAWQLSEKGFLMNLTSYVSDLINGKMKMMLQNIALQASSIDHWAIHPGGKRILDDFCTTMNLTENNLSESYAVLKEYGNMSSATVLFVLKRVLEKQQDASQKGYTFSAAFGPGLSVETMQIQHV